MEEIIAKRKGSILACFIVLIVCGVIVTLVSLIPLISGLDKLVGAVLLVFGLVFLGAGIGGTVWLAKMPKIYVKYKDGKIILGNGVVCSPSEVDYCDATPYWIQGAIFDYGKLTISVSQKVYKFRYVTRVSKAANTINNLKSQYIAIENAQKEIAERNAAENQDTTEK